MVHKRCAGLDVHQKSITACVRVALKRKVVRETRVFRYSHERIAENGGLAGAERLHDCSDGSDRSVLEAGVACARRSFRVGVGTTGPRMVSSGASTYEIK